MVTHSQANSGDMVMWYGVMVNSGPQSDYNLNSLKLFLKFQSRAATSNYFTSQLVTDYWNNWLTIQIMITFLHNKVFPKL